MSVMRLVLLAASVSLVLVGATIACSSSAPAADGGDAGKDSGKKPVEEAPPVEENPPVVEEPGTEPDAGVEDAAPPKGGELTMMGDAGALCDDTSFREAEPNNDEATANTFTPTTQVFSICGQVDAADADVVSFAMPAFPGFRIERLGAVTISGSIGGRPIDNSGGALNFGNYQSGEKVILKFSTTAAQVRPYRLTFIFN